MSEGQQPLTRRQARERQRQAGAEADRYVEPVPVGQRYVARPAQPRPEGERVGEATPTSRRELRQAEQRRSQLHDRDQRAFDRRGAGLGLDELPDEVGPAAPGQWGPGSRPGPRHAAVAAGRRPPGDGVAVAQDGRQLRVDWPTCTAHGLCHELLPEVIGLDEWGFPIIAPDALTRVRPADAKRAVAACPTLALRLTDNG